MSEPRVHAVVLAAGRSRRLGAPKQLLRFGDETLLARAVRMVRAPSASVRLVLGSPHLAIDDAASRVGALVLRSESPEEGMAASIRAAAVNLACDPSLGPRDGVLFAVVDQIALSEAHVRALVAAFAVNGGARTIASRYDDALGVPAILPITHLADLARLYGDTGARSLLRADRDVMAIDLARGAADIDVAAHLTALSAEQAS